MLDLFAIAVMIGYYVDYRHAKKNYGSKGQGTLYLVMILGILFIIVRNIFF